MVLAFNSNPIQKNTSAMTLYPSLGDSLHYYSSSSMNKASDVQVMRSQIRTQSPSRQGTSQVLPQSQQHLSIQQQQQELAGSKMISEQDVVSTNAASNANNSSTSAHAKTVFNDPPMEKNLVCKWKGCTDFRGDAEELYNHLCREHVGRKNSCSFTLECLWEGCSCKVQKRDHLTSHMRVHTPLKQHKCSICGKAFKRPQDRKKHERIHQDHTPPAVHDSRPDAIASEMLSWHASSQQNPHHQQAFFSQSSILPQSHMHHHHDHYQGHPHQHQSRSPSMSVGPGMVAPMANSPPNYHMLRHHTHHHPDQSRFMYPGSLGSQYNASSPPLANGVVHPAAPATSGAGALHDHMGQTPSLYPSLSYKGFSDERHISRTSGADSHKRTFSTEFPESVGVGGALPVGSSLNNFSPPLSASSMSNSIPSSYYGSSSELNGMPMATSPTYFVPKDTNAFYPSETVSSSGSAPVNGAPYAGRLDLHQTLAYQQQLNYNMQKQLAQSHSISPTGKYNRQGEVQPALSDTQSSSPSPTTTMAGPVSPPPMITSDDERPRKRHAGFDDVASDFLMQSQNKGFRNVNGEEIDYLVSILASSDSNRSPTSATAPAPTQASTSIASTSPTLSQSMYSSNGDQQQHAVAGAPRLNHNAPQSHAHGSNLFTSSRLPPSETLANLNNFIMNLDGELDVSRSSLLSSSTSAPLPMSAPPQASSYSSHYVPDVYPISSASQGPEYASPRYAQYGHQPILDQMSHAPRPAMLIPTERLHRRNGSVESSPMKHGYMSVAADNGRRGKFQPTYTREVSYRRASVEPAPYHSRFYVPTVSATSRESYARSIYPDLSDEESEREDNDRYTELEISSCMRVNKPYSRYQKSYQPYESNSDSPVTCRLSENVIQKRREVLVALAEFVNEAYRHYIHTHPKDGERQISHHDGDVHMVEAH